MNLIVANEITPHLTAEEYMDKGEYENELKQVRANFFIPPVHYCCRCFLSIQVVGDTQAAFDITQYDTLVFGSHGLLLAGPNSRTYEPLLAAYLQVHCSTVISVNLSVVFCQPLTPAADVHGFVCEELLQQDHCRVG